MSAAYNTKGQTEEERRVQLKKYDTARLEKLANVESEHFERSELIDMIIWDEFEKDVFVESEAANEITETIASIEEPIESEDWDEPTEPDDEMLPEVEAEKPAKIEATSSVELDSGTANMLAKHFWFGSPRQLALLNNVLDTVKRDFTAPFCEFDGHLKVTVASAVKRGIFEQTEDGLYVFTDEALQVIGGRNR